MTKRSPLKINILALLITLLGCSQMVGYVLGSRGLRGIGAATCAAPFPKVFSDVDGLETFASDFFLEGVDGEGRPFRMQITPEVYAGLEGCYNRRNVYGAALSYAPRMPPALWKAVYCYGLKKGGPLRHELGLPDRASHISVTIRTKTRNRSGVWKLESPCTE